MCVWQWLILQVDIVWPLVVREWGFLMAFLPNESCRYRHKSFLGLLTRLDFGRLAFLKVSEGSGWLFIARYRNISGFVSCSCGSPGSHPPQDVSEVVRSEPKVELLTPGCGIGSICHRHIAKATHATSHPLISLPPSRWSSSVNAQPVNQDHQDIF